MGMVLTMWRSVTAWVHAVALMVLMAAACALGTEAAKAEPAPIRIAMIEGLSGPFANAGEAVYRNLVWATERVNARGGVALADGRHRMELVRYDSQGSTETALALLRSALDSRIGFVMQGNSSATAAALVAAPRSVRASACPGHRLHRHRVDAQTAQRPHDGRRHERLADARVGPHHHERSDQRSSGHQPLASRKSGTSP